MGVVSVSVPNGRDSRGRSLMENIALGVNMASDILGAGVNAYKVFGIDKPEAEARTNLLNAQAAEVPGSKGLENRLKESQIKANEATAASAPQLQALKVAKEATDLMQAQKNLKKPVLTPAQTDVDAAFAKDYNDFVAQGGFADTQKSLGQLRAAKEQLSKTDNATGSAIGLIPKQVRDVVLPESGAIQDTVEESVQRNLRLVLGAQYTAQEGQQLLARAYNPRQSEAENIKRINRMIDQIESAAQAKMNAAKYYEEHGTLTGYKGRVAPFTISEFMPATEPPNKQPAAAPMAAPSKPDVIQNGHVYKWNAATGSYE